MHLILNWKLTLGKVCYLPLLGDALQHKMFEIRFITVLSLEYIFHVLWLHKSSQVWTNHVKIQYKIFEGLSSFCEATGIPVLVVSVLGFKTRWIRRLHASLPTYDEFLRLTSDERLVELLGLAKKPTRFTHLLLQALVQISLEASAAFFENFTKTLNSTRNASL